MNEYNLAQKILNTLEVTDEVEFTTGANTTFLWPTQGTLVDNDGIEYDLGEDSELVLMSLVRENKLSLTALPMVGKIRFSGPK